MIICLRKTTDAHPQSNTSFYLLLDYVLMSLSNLQLLHDPAIDNHTHRSKQGR